MNPPPRTRAPDHLLGARRGIGGRVAHRHRQRIAARRKQEPLFDDDAFVVALGFGEGLDPDHFVAHRLDRRHARGARSCIRPGTGSKTPVRPAGRRRRGFRTRDPTRAMVESPRPRDERDGPHERHWAARGEPPHPLVQCRQIEEIGEGLLGRGNHARAGGRPPPQAATTSKSPAGARRRTEIEDRHARAAEEVGGARSGARCTSGDAESGGNVHAALVRAPARQ